MEGELTTTVIVKTLSSTATDHTRECFTEEIALMADCKHENIINLLAVCLEDPQLMILPMLEYGFLRQFLQSAAFCLDDDDLVDNSMIDLDGSGKVATDFSSAAMLSNADLTLIASQVASAMTYLAERGFVHKDLSTRCFQVCAKKCMSSLVHCLSC